MRVLAMNSGLQDERFRRLLDLISSGSFISITDLAREFKLSASHLQHLYKTQTGHGLGRRMVESRLNKAALLLVESDLSIKEIAYTVGYKHASSFARAFERSFQKAPSDFRQLRQEMLTERQFS